MKVTLYVGASLVAVLGASAALANPADLTIPPGAPMQVMTSPTALTEDAPAGSDSGKAILEKAAAKEASQQPVPQQPGASAEPKRPTFKKPRVASPVAARWVERKPRPVAAEAAPKPASMDQKLTEAPSPASQAAPQPKVAEDPKPAQPKAAQKTDADYTVLTINGKSLKARQIASQAPRLTELSGASSWQELSPSVQDDIAKALVQRSLLLEAADKTIADSDPEFQRELQLAKDNARVNLYRERFMRLQNHEAAVRRLYNERVEAYAASRPALTLVHYLASDQDVIQKLHDALSAGRSSASVTKAFQDRGVVATDMDNVTRDELPDGLSDAAFALNIGQFTKPIQSELGWHVFVAKAKAKPKPPSFEELRPELEAQVAAKLWGDHIQSLQEKATLQYFNSDGTPRKLP